MRRKKVRATLAEQNQKSVLLYRESGQPWPATARQIANWAINEGLWTQEFSAKVSACAREIADAMRQEYILDSDGNHVRSKICAKLRLRDDDEQKMFWNDLKDVPREFLVSSLQDRRKQVVGECRQMQLQQKFFNKHNPSQEPIQTSFDFRDDLAEMDMPKDYQGAA
jgi:hypothetical protein